MGVLIDRDCTSESVLAKAHGRVDMLLCLTSSVLTLLYTLTLNGNVGSVAFMSVACALALLRLYCIMVYQPMLNQYWNRLAQAFLARLPPTPHPAPHPHTHPTPRASRRVVAAGLRCTAWPKRALG
jgi:hypothetical protein